MKINREKLVQHLQRVVCGGQITEAVFTETFATAAITLDHQLFVAAPALPKTRPVLLKVGESAGLPDLKLLLWALDVNSGVGNEAVDVEVRLENRRLVVDEGERGKLELMTADERTIGTRLEDETVQALFNKAPAVGEGGIPLTRQFVESVRKVYSGLKEDEVELSVGPKGGELLIGTGETANRFRVPFEQGKVKEKYSLLFGAHLVAVLGVLVNFNEAMLYLGGPESFALIDDGGYQYILSPHVKSADA
jgi:hypothetical protein